jgi:hypothetical protein
MADEQDSKFATPIPLNIALINAPPKTIFVFGFLNLRRHVVRADHLTNGISHKLVRQSPAERSGRLQIVPFDPKGVIADDARVLIVANDSIIKVDLRTSNTSIKTYQTTFYQSHYYEPGKVLLKHIHGHCYIDAQTEEFEVCKEYPTDGEYLGGLVLSGTHKYSFELAIENKKIYSLDATGAGTTMTRLIQPFGFHFCHGIIDYTLPMFINKLTLNSTRWLNLFHDYQGKAYISIYGLNSGILGCKKHQTTNLEGQVEVVGHENGFSGGFKYFMICAYGKVTPGGNGIITCYQTVKGKDAEADPSDGWTGGPTEYLELLGTGVSCWKLSGTSVLDKMIGVFKTPVNIDILIGTIDEGNVRFNWNTITSM